MSLEQLSVTASLLHAIACFAAALDLSRLRPLARPVLGPRGLERARWLERPWAAVVEPIVRYFGALAARLPCARTRAALATLIERAGYSRGLCSDECLALCVLLAGFAFALVSKLAPGTAFALAAAALGAALPVLDLLDRARLRRREIGRRLPDAVDLMALCMGAGLDFAGALDRVTRELAATSHALGAELQRVQQELALGRTRARVLAELAERVPAPAVRDFARAVIQAEQRGTPLAEVLVLQARTARMRRSVAAEEAAARASVLLLLPLLLLLGAIMLVLFGPFIVNGVGL